MPSIANLVDLHGLPDGAGERLDTLLGALVSDPLAPTAVHDRQRAIDDHLADSLVALGLDVVKSARTIADLGSGAGAPGLPLAIALPLANVFLVESNARKCAFLEGTVRRCGLGNVEVVNRRVEAWDEWLGRLDLVTTRALAALPVVAEYAAPLLARGGALVVWRGRRDAAEERAAAVAADELGLEMLDPVPVRPYPAAQHRHLHVMLKVRPTPARYPRRPGVASKRPLGGPRRSEPTGD